MNYNKIEKLKDQLRDKMLDRISTYLNDVDIYDYITDADIDNVIEDRIGNYMTDMLGDILEEVADEVFDNL